MSRRDRRRALEASKQLSYGFELTSLPKPLWGAILLIDFLIFLLGVFTGQLSPILLSFVLTLLMEFLRRRGLLRGIEGDREQEGAAPQITSAQRREIIEELRSQRKAKRAAKKEGNLT